MNRFLLKYKNLTGGQIIFNKLIENNVKDAFIYSGGAIMPVIDCFYKQNDINYYINCHEQNAGHAATGYAKSTGKTGVVIATSGPGLTNLITPMLDAMNDSVPLVVFSGQVGLSAVGTTAFQECDAINISKPVCKFSHMVETIDELPDVIDYAFYIANNKKKGTVHIDLPKCITTSIYDNDNNDRFIYKKDTQIYYSIYDSIKKIKNLDNKNIDFDNKINKIANVINNSKKPIFYLGHGCVSGYELLRECAIKAQIPVTTTLHGMGIFDESDKENENLVMHMCGMHGSYYSNMALQNSDCIIAVGSRFDDRTTGNIDYYAPEARKAAKQNKGGIIHCNIENAEINKTVKSDYDITCDSKLFLEKLLPKLRKKKRVDWFKQIKKWKKDHPFEYTKPINNKIKTQCVIKEINKQTNKLNNVFFTFGVGNHQMMGCQFIDWKRPRQVISSGSLGVMGCSSGYAIGTQIANPDSMVISIDGDGSFNMTSSELKTIVEYNLPIKIAVINDGYMTMVKTWEKLFFDGRYTATKNSKNPDYVKLAESYGIMGISCDNTNNLEDTIKTFIEYDGPILCDFKVIGGECFPLVGPGKALDDMILHKTYNKNTKLTGIAPN